MTSPSPATTPVELTLAELAVLDDILTQVLEGAQAGTYQPQFAAAAVKIGAAAHAAGPAGAEGVPA